jgi:hypothetical protein
MVGKSSEVSGASLGLIGIRGLKRTALSAARPAASKISAAMTKTMGQRVRRRRDVELGGIMAASLP